MEQVIVDHLVIAFRTDEIIFPPGYLHDDNRIDALLFGILPNFINVGDYKYSRNCFYKNSNDNEVISFRDRFLKLQVGGEKSFGNFLGDFRDGLTINYHPNGEIKEVGEYRKVVNWVKNGKFTSSLPIREWRRWDQNGNPLFV